MIIGIDATRANKPQKTGVEWYSYHLIRELAQLPSRHILRLYFRNTPEEGLQNLGPNVTYRILRWPLPYLWTQMRLSWEMLIHPPDLLFIPAQIIPLIHPARTITTIHDVAFKPYPDSYRLRSRLYLDFAARLARRLPMILTISEFSRQEIHAYYAIPLASIVVTPLGFAHDESKPAPIAPAKFGVREPYLLYIGRLERKKNVSVIVKSFNLIKKEKWGRNFQLILAGVKGHGWEAIERLIRSSAFREDIKIIGWITEAEKHSLLERATAFILLSAYEGFGLPLLEAMASRTPVIASDQAALPEIAGSAAYLVPRGSSKAVRDALKDIIHNAAVRNQLITAGEKRVRDFTWRKTAEKTMEAFEALLKRIIL